MEIGILSVTLPIEEVFPEVNENGVVIDPPILFDFSDNRTVFGVFGFKYKGMWYTTSRGWGKSWGFGGPISEDMCKLFQDLPTAMGYHIGLFKKCLIGDSCNLAEPATEKRITKRFEKWKQQY